MNRSINLLPSHLLQKCKTCSQQRKLGNTTLVEQCTLSKFDLNILGIIIITNEKIKVMLSQKRCSGTLQDYKKGEINKCQSKLWMNRNDFSWCLNGTSEETVRSDNGRLFHARGAVTEKARSPRVDLCTGGKTSVVAVDDHRWRRLSTSAVKRMFSARYAGADPLRQRCVRTQRQNVIRSGTRSQ